MPTVKVNEIFFHARRTVVARLRSKLRVTTDGRVSVRRLRRIAKIRRRQR